MEEQPKRSLTVEIPDGVNVIFMGKKRVRDRRDFVKVYGEALEWLAINITSFTARRVLDILIANVDYDGLIRLKQKDIAEKINTYQANVADAIKELQAKNIISISKDGKTNVYVINSDIAWKNDEDSKKANKKKFELIKGNAGQQKRRPTMRKLVERDHINYLVSELFYIKLQAPGKLQERIQDLIKFIEDNIVQGDQDSKNEFKRVVYKRMKEAKTPEENRQWYDFYKSLDNTFERCAIND